MRQLVKDQLNSCVFADLSDTVEYKDCYVIRIPKYNKPKYDIGRMYVITVGNEIVNNTTSDFSITKNNGTAPKTPCLKIYVSKQHGKLIYVNSIGFDAKAYQDLPNIWSGWLPLDNIGLLAKL